MNEKAERINGYTRSVSSLPWDPEDVTGRRAFLASGDQNKIEYRRRMPTG